MPRAATSVAPKTSHVRRQRLNKTLVKQAKQVKQVLTTCGHQDVEDASTEIRERSLALLLVDIAAHRNSSLRLHTLVAEGSLRSHTLVS